MEAESVEDQDVAGLKDRDHLLSEVCAEPLAVDRSSKTQRSVILLQ